nr:hypothetical protein [uncultured Pseudomonas sp.]
MSENLEAEIVQLKTKFESLKMRCTEKIADYRSRHCVEREVIIDELLTAQENFEKSLSDCRKLSNQSNEAFSYIAKLLLENPSVLTNGRLKVEDLGINAGARDLQWEINDVYLHRRYHKIIRFKIRLNDDHLTFILQRDKNTEGPLVRWPATHRKIDEIEFSPVRGPINKGKNLSLASLGTTDWSSLIELVSIVLNIARSNTLPLEKSVAALLEVGLNEFNAQLLNFPPVLRFDSIVPAKILHQDSYWGVTLRLRNLMQGDKHWPSLVYSLTSVDSSDKTRGENPRIELPKEASEFLENWFIETADDRGERFELRFRMPREMDMLVWQKLSETDQVRLISLLSILEVQLSELKEIDVNMDWGRWMALGTSMRDTIAERMSGR